MSSKAGVCHIGIRPKVMSSIVLWRCASISQGVITLVSGERLLHLDERKLCMPMPRHVLDLFLPSLLLKGVGRISMSQQCVDKQISTHQETARPQGTSPSTLLPRRVEREIRK